MEGNDTRDWIEYIADRVYENYRNRTVILWGKYTESEKIEKKLKEKYQIEKVCYIDSDAAKVDSKRVFSTEYICGNSLRYYVVIPLAVNHSIKDFLNEAGYRKDLDYYYFSDCVRCQERDYYEDEHGNRIIGCYQGLKFVFSGFDSVIEIKGKPKFHNTALYLHNNSKIIIENCQELHETELWVRDSSSVMLGGGVYMSNCDIRIEDDVTFEADSECSFLWMTMQIKNKVQILTGGGGKILGNSCS